MQAGVDTSRFGGIFLPEVLVHGFLKVDEYTRQTSHVVYVDPKRFQTLWYKDISRPRIGSPPGPFSEWETEEQAAFVWRLLKGPRRPVALPHVTFKNGLVDVGAGRLYMQAFLDWGAIEIPVTVKDSDAIAIKSAAGAERHDPMPGNFYLATTQKVLGAFEDNISPFRLYAPEVGKLSEEPSFFEEIKQGVVDYGRLIHIQLETMLIRYSLRQKTNSEIIAEQNEKELCEVRRLLHQQAAVVHWLSQPADMGHLPHWEQAEGVSINTALSFLEKNKPDLHKERNIFQAARIASVTSTEDITESPTRSEKRPALRLVRPEDNLN